MSTEHVVTLREALLAAQEVVHAWDGERTHANVYYAVERVIDDLRALLDQAVPVEPDDIWAYPDGSQMVLSWVRREVAS